MWLAKKAWQTVQLEKRQAAPGIAAQMGGEYAIGEYEYRNLPSCGPFGVFSRPPEGTDILVLSTGSGEISAGAVTEAERLPQLEPGELLLRSAGGASIRLCADGKVLINGTAVGKDGRFEAK